jgi:ubiquitin-like-conjugating enzyme ATG10
MQSFPHLSNHEFSQACTGLVDKFRRHSNEQVEWVSVETLDYYESIFLRITKELPHRIEAARDVEYDEVSEDDDEALQAPVVFVPLIHFDVLLSPVYRVPVLYISISDPLHRFPPTMETLYEQLIPVHFKTQAERTGVIGGVTINVCNSEAL